jgi:hypothetical protein
MFLQAEAIARGWLTGDAEEAYRNAVIESFNYLKVPSATATAETYLEAGSDKIAWPASGSLTDKIKVIAWQKYFALNGIQANETWTDVRRLGVVQPPLSVIASGNVIPRRLLYPTSEYNYNADNVNAEGDISQFTSKVFWDL